MTRLLIYLLATPIQARSTDYCLPASPLWRDLLSLNLEQHRYHFGAAHEEWLRLLPYPLNH